jgi:hypothetical protein
MVPGLIFSVFRRLRVPGRVAWWWMWLLPTGWCYVFQAGSSLNDSFALVYALAAVDFALRARERNSVPDLWWSALAVALLTGVKQTNIPLALLWSIPVCACWRLLKQRAGATMLVVLVAVLISVVPVTISDMVHYGAWMGDNDAQWKGVLPSPFWGLVGNLFCFPAQNLLPPFFPWSDSWNAMMDRFVTTPFGSHFSAFENFGYLSRYLHGVGETNAGIGLGICLFMTVSIASAWWFRRRPPRPVGVQKDWVLWLLLYSPWALLVLFLAKVGTFENARQFAPYYPFLFPSLLIMSGHVFLVRKRWWQGAGILLMLTSVFLLAISRGRPLFPAQTILGGLEARYPSSHFIKRLAFGFNAATGFGPKFKSWVIQNSPAGEKTVGFGGLSCFVEPTLWLPYGHWQVIHVLPDDTLQQWKADDIHYLFVTKDYMGIEETGIQAWLDRFDADLVAEYKVQTQIGKPDCDIFLVKLHD